MERVLISTLSHYACILSCSTICNICATIGDNIWPRPYSRMCFNPLGIYMMSFQSLPTLCNPLQCFYLFSMFACLYLTYCYTNRLFMHSPHYSIHIQYVSDHFQPFNVFIYLHSYQYSNVLIIVDWTISDVGDSYHTFCKKRCFYFIFIFILTHMYAGLHLDGL